MLAQEVENVYPDLVKTVGEGPTALKAVEYPNLTAVAITALKQINTMMLNAGSAKLAEQERQIQILEKRISELELGNVWDPRNPPPQ
ncbi:hypothetical protein KBC03_03565 [Patescibacteria group bacterium]|nr:hypothetical protein [Patescibacteria group bacterium]